MDQALVKLDQAASDLGQCSSALDKASSKPAEASSNASELVFAADAGRASLAEKGSRRNKGLLGKLLSKPTYDA